MRHAAATAAWPPCAAVGPGRGPPAAERMPSIVAGAAAAASPASQLADTTAAAAPAPRVRAVGRSAAMHNEARDVKCMHQPGL